LLQYTSWNSPYAQGLFILNAMFNKGENRISKKKGIELVDHPLLSLPCANAESM
jgi:hypothetical protein